MTATTLPTSVAIEGLIASIREVVQRESEPARVGEGVAAALQPWLGNVELLTEAQLEPDPARWGTPIQPGSHCC